VDSKCARIIGGAIALFVHLVCSSAFAQTIDQIQTYTAAGVPASPYAGQTVTVSGVLLEYHNYNTGSGYLVGPDGSGISMFGGTGDAVAVGDEVQVTGTVSSFSGEIQINVANYTKLSSGHVLTPESMPIAQIRSTYENVGHFGATIGTVARKTTSGTAPLITSNIWIKSGTDSLLIFCDKDCRIDTGAVAVGDVYWFSGPIRTFNTQIQIYPVRQSDLIENPGYDLSANTSPVIRDVPNDQGGQVSVSWRRHGGDAASVPNPVVLYELQKWQAGWQVLTSVAAAQADSYQVVVPTTDIVALGGPLPFSRYRVVSWAVAPFIQSPSRPDSGFSVDNLPPPKPAARVEHGATYRYVMWTDPSLPDFSEACVYRGTESGFTPSVPLACPADFYDETDLGPYYYRVQFADVHGNLSEFSDEVQGRWPLPAYRELYVATDGDDGGTGDHASPFRTIQRAVDVAANGDHVVIRDGVYSGPGNVNIIWHDKDVAIRSESGNRAACVIECGGENGFSFRDAVTDGQQHAISFDGMTIAAADTALVVSVSSHTPFLGPYVLVGISNSTLRDGQVGVYTIGGAVDLNSVQITGNAQAGLVGSEHILLATMNCVVRNNGVGVTFFQDSGGGQILFESTDFVANGVGLHYAQETSGVTMRHCRVDSSTTGDGVACVVDYDPLTMEDCQIVGNTRIGVNARGAFLNMTRCNVAGNGSHGIGYASYMARYRLEAVTISGNHGLGIGPPLWNMVAVVVPKHDPSAALTVGARVITQCEVRENALGGINLEFPPVVDNTTIVNNGGAGLCVGFDFAGGAPLSIANVTIAGNYGNGIDNPEADLLAANSLIAHNGGSALNPGASTTATLACTDIYGNRGGDWTTPIVAQLGLDGNLHVAPQFCDAANGDYHLQQGSPLSSESAGACGTIGRFDWNCPAQPAAPFVPILRDVPGDQGGKLQISWLRNAEDAPTAWIPVTSYDVQRFHAGWQTIATLAAAAADTYSTMVETADIVTVGHPVPYSRYRLIARTANPSVTFESVVDSAASVDNLAPPKPAAMIVDAPTYRYILWTIPGVPDLASACVFRGTAPGFIPDVAAACPADFYAEQDLGWYFYRVQFADIHGNLSEFSDEMHGRWPTPVPEAGPVVLRLYPCQPNPFNPRTTIRFDLPVAGTVRLAVFDLAGRMVRTLVGEDMSPGTHEVLWDGRDGAGREVGSGTYLTRLEVDGKVQTIRMGLVR
jgi:hypothetical protein